VIEPGTVSGKLLLKKSSARRLRTLTEALPPQNLPTPLLVKHAGSRYVRWRTEPAGAPV